jgi:hypothetical protein
MAASFHRFSNHKYQDTRIFASQHYVMYFLPRLPENDDSADDLKSGTCCGLRWKPLFFLVLFVGPAILGGMLTVSEWFISVSGIQVPEFFKTSSPGPDHRARLMAFYRKNNPGKIGKRLSAECFRVGASSDLKTVSSNWLNSQ